MPFSNVKQLIFALIILSFSVFSLGKAKTKDGHDEFHLLKVTTKRYQQSALVEMNVEKIVKSDLMGSETRYTGKVNLSSGLFRWENLQPEKSLLVFDGDTIWSEQTPSSDFPGPVQVAKAKVDKKNKSRILLSTILGKSSIFENFKVLKEEKTENETQYLIEPKVKDLNINQLTLILNAQDKTLVGVSYKDDVGNLTVLKFSSIEFLKKNKNKNLFKYTPPKGAQVTNL